MTSDASALGSVVHLEDYPIHALGSRRGRLLVADCKRQLTEHGVCSLPAFLTGAAIKATTEAGDRLANQAWHANQTHNVYFTSPDTSGTDDLQPGDPRTFQVRSSQHAIAYDLLPEDLPIRRLYESDEMTRFVAAVLGFDQIYRSIDPLDALEISLYGDGDELGWHFDNSEFSVTLMLREPAKGGHFEFHRTIRSESSECYNDVNAAISGSGARPQRLVTAPGTLALFRGRYALHRVTPVVGSVTRMNTVLTYGTESDMCLSELTQRLFYGRRVKPPGVN
ncbi:MAG: 2OG-Fe(II) oxygenase [Actinobacteria bacterium]|nr:2OG-Fe(II) oxygenase [Actinomycetota bacterium]